MKYLGKFDNHKDYESFIEGKEYVTPNVSVCVDKNEVHYNPLELHKYVDLGLPSGTLWATENIKDDKGSDLYFAWGETSGYTVYQVGIDKDFSTEDYAFGQLDFNDRTDYGMTKYNSTDGKETLEPTDDAASVNWGNNWKIPTERLFEELLENTTTAFTQVDGINGLLCTSTANTNTLFFPAAGEIVEGNYYEGNALYWSSSLGETVYLVCILDGPMIPLPESGARHAGHTIRPVRVR